MTFLLILWLLQSNPVAFENEYVRVMRDSAPCASATTTGCGDRVIVALGEIELRSGPSSRKVARKMTRGDIAVFKPGESYEPPTGGAFFEVAFKANHPPVESPREIIAPEKNAMRYEGERFFIFEERLDPGDTRPRHSHSQRVVVQLNRTRLQQLPDGEPEVVREIVPDRAAFNPPVIHTVKNVGDEPLRGIVIEFKPEQRKPLSK
jgi:quercetin dioxygenase-like cupin family protein